MKIYIAGKITGAPGYREKFANAQRLLSEKGYTVMNPAILPDGFDWWEYMSICFKMLDVCDGVALLPCWQDSKGAKLECEHALHTGKCTKTLKEWLKPDNKMIESDRSNHLQGQLIFEGKDFGADQCVRCGVVIPEGRQICLDCELETKAAKYDLAPKGGKYE